MLRIRETEEKKALLTHFAGLKDPHTRESISEPPQVS